MSVCWINYFPTIISVFANVEERRVYTAMFLYFYLQMFRESIQESVRILFFFSTLAIYSEAKTLENGIVY